MSIIAYVLLVLWALGIICIDVMIFMDNNKASEPQTNIAETLEPSEPSEISEDPEPSENSETSQKFETPYQEIDFQPIVDDWAKSVSGDKSVLIYDLDLEKTVGEYNADVNRNTASLYKLPIVYEGYRRVARGEWDGNAKAGTIGKTVLKCLDLAIRQSDSLCAETLRNMIGRAELDTINPNILALSSNARDIAKIMKNFYYHDEIQDDKLLATMKDSFLNQPTIGHDNWRRGLPSGFSDATVYNKVGWDYNAEEKYWNVYNDAAIVEFPEQNRHFIVVVMTSHIMPKKIAELGTMIENLVGAAWAGINNLQGRHFSCFFHDLLAEQELI